ncbi:MULTISPECIES: antibiotic biosynthesis monooxygenase family protein [unclassified Pseudomonas]|jgi:quinol monooxygenase YgiN|uniref:antibiotic biosynthesis monooxygenase family protein n=1 Tax=unclassified Pseudomonas TaxID=196821 RepID=UPI000DA78FB8|nr:MULTISPECIES: antibiotic biosynthesis monooxygenase family protein [unclassified Pseudomonas]MDW3712446.1 antibiotic biosynthesis monooxygenase family protein [Pseudomonas sp. 2023EL-01195]PZE11198.1 antibiotic biosynthesis monooxygenase [Pseudomonas sp. 57B-090624]
MTLSPTFTSLASLRARNGRSEELGERLLALVEPARRIEGCISHEVLRAPDDPDLWLLQGCWANQAALEHYCDGTCGQCLADVLQGTLVLEARYFTDHA